MATWVIDKQGSLQTEHNADLYEVDRSRLPASLQLSSSNNPPDITQVDSDEDNGEPEESSVSLPHSYKHAEHSSASSPTSGLQHSTSTRKPNSTRKAQRQLEDAELERALEAATFGAGGDHLFSSETHSALPVHSFFLILQ